jgi:hypothetical protein
MIHFVENVLNSQVGLFIIGMSLTVPPVMGIMLIHKSK